MKINERRKWSIIPTLESMALGQGFLIFKTLILDWINYFKTSQNTLFSQFHKFDLNLTFEVHAPTTTASRRRSSSKAPFCDIYANQKFLKGFYLISQQHWYYIPYLSPITCFIWIYMYIFASANTAFNYLLIFKCMPILFVSSQQLRFEQSID